MDGPLTAEKVEEVEEGGEPSYSREAEELCGSRVVMEGREGVVQRSTCNGLDRFWVVCAERKWRPLDPSSATVVERHDSSASRPSGPTDQAAVGCRVSMFWRAELPPSWFTGVVKQFNPASGEHLVVYEDGDQRWHGMEAEAREDNVRWLDPQEVSA